MKTALTRRLTGILSISFFILAAVPLIFGAGEIDSSFTASVYGGISGNINSIKVQPDGKILVAGLINEVGGIAANGIARLNADGTVDTSFKSPDFTGGIGLGGQILTIALQSDGKILVGGGYFSVNGVYFPGVRRLNPDGSLDTSFNVVQLLISSFVYDIKIQPDNKILVGGSFTVVGGRSNLIRLNADGTLDNTFASNISPIKSFDIQTDGKIVAGGETSATAGFLQRVNSSGSPDTSFAPASTSGNNGGINVVKLRSDGKILIGGGFNNVNANAVGGITQINPDGSIDLTFNQGNFGSSGEVNDIELLTNGKIFIGGFFVGYNGVGIEKVARLNADGTLDTTFQVNSNLNFLTVNDVEILPDNGVLVGTDNRGIFTDLYRFSENGSRDVTFSPRVTWSGTVRKVLQQPDGKVLALGLFQIANAATRRCIARFNADGSLDTSFVPYFSSTSNPNCNGLALQPDGKILLAMESFGVLRRMNPDGSQDAFTPALGGIAYDVVPLPNGQILVGGTFGILRFNANAVIDSTFPTVQANGAVRKILVQPDGKILISGDFTQIGATQRNRIARLNETDGSLDTSFNPVGGASGQIADIDLQTDGKIVVGGSFSFLNGSSNQARIGRLNADGSLDTTFMQTVDNSVLAVKIQPDGKILIGGAMTFVQNTPHSGIARLNPDGTVDNAFNTQSNWTVWDINMQTDGKILIGGEFNKINGLSAVRIARLTSTNLSQRFFDYDGDGRADVSVFRPSENKWYILRSSDFAVTQTVFGIPDDIPVPADYDGDGKTDLAVFRPSNGDWWYLASLNNAQININWGQAGDIPRPSDFDGDGKTDLIVYRPANNVWYHYGTTGQISILAFGSEEDKPLIGDFDGDGKTEPAIFRPSTGDWWYASSITGQFVTMHWGTNGDIPVPADYDGDGKTDLAVFRPSNGFWYIANSGDGSFRILPFGLTEDKPIAADYDGDGKADTAVYRPSTGTWYLLQTTAGFGALQFGIATDIPTENAFID